MFHASNTPTGNAPLKGYVKQTCWHWRPIDAGSYRSADSVRLIKSSVASKAYSQFRGERETERLPRCCTFYCSSVWVRWPPTFRRVDFRSRERHIRTNDVTFLLFGLIRIQICAYIQSPCGWDEREVSRLDAETFSRPSRDEAKSMELFNRGVRLRLIGQQCHERREKETAKQKPNRGKVYSGGFIFA